MDYTRPWYHGSPLVLTVLRKGSTITQRRELARIFSHKPSLVVIDDDAGDSAGAGAVSIRHNGTEPGYLYVIAEAVRPGDVTPHPRTTMGPGDEWLITRELRVTLLGTTQLRQEEILGVL